MDESRVILTQYYVAERQSLVEEATRLLRGDRMTAEDVVQTTFLRLLNSTTPHLSLHAPHSSLPALVHATMLNLLRDLWRRRRYEQDYEHQLATAPSWARQADDVFSICSAHQITELLEHRLARMDSTVARVLRMNIVEEKPVSEISDELQMKYKTVENRLQTGRRQLRSYMKRAV
ncbi:MAG: sigma-70 family RNA polymerase sigma factor [Prevotella sp.]|nr:sigma-70 family RNA polymerase sigma factor [Prevotella sp.]MBR6188191.1 sigma-70 family RNA polymerase sigma factor [Prevotella sp.]